MRLPLLFGSKVATAVAALAGVAAISVGAFAVVQTGSSGPTSSSTTSVPSGGGSNVSLPAAGPRDAAGVPLELGLALAKRYAPLVFFDPSEPDYPMGVDQFLALATPPNLAYDESCSPFNATPVAVNGPMTPDQLLHTAVTQSALPQAGCSFSPLQSTTPDPEAPRYGGTKPNQTLYLTTLPDDDNRRGLDTSHWVTYYHVYPTDDGGLMVQYWHFFAYNHQVSDSRVAAGQGDHYGDWDASIQVQLDSSMTIEKVWFSRHNNDHPGDPLTSSAQFQRGANTQVGTVYMSGDHPLMMADSGSHAAFASPADYCDFQSQGLANYTGKVVWGDPNSPSELQRVDCSQANPHLKQQPVGGTVWSTSSDGPVTHSPNLDNQIKGQQGGPLLDLGQFNPGTMSSCHVCAGIAPPEDPTKPIEQWGSWFPGEAGVFTGYSGLWGSPTEHSTFVYPPRGPVYQGFVEGSGFSAWYNHASSTKWSPPNPGDRYVALGDSYASGEGVPPFISGTDTATNQCHRSTAAYSQLLVHQHPGGPIPNTVEFWACSGSETNDFSSPNHSSGEAPQLDRLAPGNATIVTISIGGNDIGFAHIGATCLKVEASVFKQLNGNYKPNCRDVLEPETTTKINNLDLGSLYAAIRKKAPQAQVFVTGYPRILPANPSSDCQAQAYREDGRKATGNPLDQNATDGILGIETRIAKDDVIWMNNVIDRLNNKIRSSAAAAAGFNYVDVTDAFAGHDVCNNNTDPSNRPWAHGLVLFSNSNKSPPNPSPFSFHPNGYGQAAMADYLFKAITASQQASRPPISVVPPSLLVFSGDTPVHEPVQFWFTGDSTGYVDNLTWSSWGAGGAVGSGTLHINDCTPNCASGTFKAFPAAVNLSGATQTPHGFLFTQLAIDSPTAPGGSQTFPIPRW